MALEKQNISISLAQGVDTKTDPKQVIQGKLLVLQNAHFQTPKEIRKLPGYAQVGNTLASNTGNAVSPFMNELISLDGENVFSYSKEQTLFNNRGTKVAVDLSTQSIVKNTYQQSNCDFAFSTFNYSVSAWEDSSGGIRYSVFDNTTNQSVVSNVLVTATGSMPKVIALANNKTIIAYVDNASTSPVLKYVSLDSTALTVISAPVTLQAMTVGFVTYDAERSGNNVYFIVRTNVNHYVVFFLSLTLVQSLILTINDTIDTSFIFGDGSGNVWFGGAHAAGASTTVFATVYNSALTVQVLAKTIIETIAIDGVGPVVSHVTGLSPATTGTFFYEIVNPDGFSYDQYVRTNTLTIGGSVGTARDFNRSVGLASKPFINNGVIYVAVVHDSSLQQTYFVLDVNSNIVTKIAPGNGGGLIKTGLLPEVMSPISGVFEFPFLQKDLLSSVAGNVFTQTGVSLAILTFGSPLETNMIANNLHVTGGVLTMYDGANVVEHNFHVFPENVSTTVAFAGGGLSIGTYQYVAVWEWTDAQGQVHYSAPSVPVSVDNTGDTLVFFGDVTTATIGPLSQSRITNIKLPNTPAAGSPDTIWPQPLVPGMIVVSPGNLTDPTYIMRSGPYLYNPTEILVYDFVTTNIPALANASQVQITTLPRFSNTAINTTNGSPNVQVTAQEVYGTWIFDCVKGSNVFTVYNPSGLAVGMSVSQAPSSSPIQGTISAITGNKVTFVNNSNVVLSAPETVTGMTVSMEFQIHGTCTVGTNVMNAAVLGFNGSTITPLNSGLYLGQIVYDSGATTFTAPGTTITAIGASTVTFSNNFATASVGPNAVFGYSDWAATKLQVGQHFQTRDNTTIPPGAIIKSVTIPAKTQTGIPVIVLDTNASASMSDIDAFTTDVTSVRVEIPTLRLTAKTNANGNSPVVIGIYRTVANGTTFFKVSSITNPLINNNTVDSLAFYDNATDTQIIGNQELYTTGGVVENFAVPATSILTSFKNRLIAVPSENPTSFWYSQQVVPTTPVQFSDLFVENIDTRGGPITAMAVMDDKLILFKESTIFYVVGDGPTPNGSNNNFSEANLIATNIGCINKKSVVSTAVGVMFQSSDGIWLLDRSLSTTYIGADVEQFNNQTVTSAQIIPGFTQVRFTLNGGIVLVYDYFGGQWSIRGNVSAADSCISSDLFTYISPLGVINQETPNAFTDNGSLVPISMTTSWLSFANLQSFQRVYKLLVLGQWKSPHTLTINVYYDFNSTPVQTTVIPMLTNPSPNPYQFRVFLQRQKCETIQINITETQVPTYGEGLSVSALAFEVGAKVGLDKLATNNTYD